jgi:hypothetical protein
MEFDWGRTIIGVLVRASLLGIIAYSVYSVLRALLRRR